MPQVNPAQQSLHCKSEAALAKEQDLKSKYSSKGSSRLLAMSQQLITVAIFAILSIIMECVNSADVNIVASFTKTLPDASITMSTTPMYGATFYNMTLDTPTATLFGTATLPMFGFTEAKWKDISGVKFFDMAGNLVAQAPSLNTNNFTYTICGIGNMKYLLADNNAAGSINKFQFSPTKVGSIVNEYLTNSATGGLVPGSYPFRISAAAYVEGTVYTVLGGTSLGRYIYTLDNTNRNVKVCSDQTNLTDASRIIIKPSDNVIIIFAQFSGILPIYRRDTITVYKSLALKEKLIGSMINNLNEDQLFMLTADNVLRYVDLLSSMTYAIEPATPLSLTNPLTQSHLFNFGMFQLFGLMRKTSGLVIQLVDKKSFTLRIQTTVLSLGTGNVGNFTLVGPYSFEDKFYLGYIQEKTTPTTASVFQGVYLFFNFCYLRKLTNCTRCYTNYYKDKEEPYNLCYAPSDFPNRFGINTGKQLMAPCQQSACFDCTTDYTKCLKCDKSAGYYLLEATGMCLLKEDIPERYGAYDVEMKIYSCVNSNCLDCRLNYTSCTKCDGPAGYFLDKDTCGGLNGIFDGEGIDWTTSLVKPCSMSNCLDCKANYLKCIICDTKEKYEMVDDICVYKDCEGSACFITLKTSKYDAAKSLASIRFTEEIVANEKAKFILTIYDQIKETSYICPPNKCIMKYDNDGYIIDFKLDFEIQKGYLSIDYDTTPNDLGLLYNPVRSKDRSKDFIDYPIIVNNINHFTNSWYGRLVNVSASVVYFINLMRLIFNFFLIFYSPFLSTLLDKVLSSFAYLRLLNGVYLTVPELLFYRIARSDYILDMINNPFDKLVGSVYNCITKKSFIANQMECNIMSNYGRNLVVLYFLLIINSMISVTYWLVTKRKMNKFIKDNVLDKAAQQKMLKESTLWRILDWMNDSYGWRFFIIKMDGVCFEVISYSYVNLASRPRNLAMTIGFTMSFFFLVFYCSLAIMVVYYVRDIQKQIKEKPVGENTEKVALQNLSRFVDLRESKLGILDFLFDQCKFPLKFSQLFYPVVSYLRMVLVGFVVFSFADAGYSQAFIVLLIESAYLGYLIKNQVRLQVSYHVAECVAAGFCVLYIFVKLLAYIGSFNEVINQNVFGTAMAMLIITLVGVVYLYICVMIVRGAIQGFKNLKKYIRDIKRHRDMRYRAVNNKNFINNRNVITDLQRAGKIEIATYVPEEDDEHLKIDDKQIDLLAIHKQDGLKRRLDDALNDKNRFKGVAVNQVNRDKHDFINNKGMTAYTKVQNHEKIFKKSDFEDDLNDKVNMERPASSHSTMTKKTVGSAPESLDPRALKRKRQKKMFKDDL